MNFRYTNPITRDPAMAMRDHQILKVGNRWFMTGTTAPFWTGPNPGVRLFSSPDLLHWTFEKWLIQADDLPDECPYLGRFWAPEIHETRGVFWLTVNSGHAGPDSGDRRMDGHGVHLFRADAVTGPYFHVAGPIGQGFKNDAHLFTGEDGRTFLYASGGGLWQAEIDLKMGKLTGGRDELEKILGPRDPGLPEWMIGGVEGPFVIQRDGAWFLFFSAWTRGYEVGVLRGDSPLGPWKLHPDSPIFGCRKRRYRENQMREGGYAHLVFDDTPDPYVETGHGAIFEGPDGKDWFCCHYFPEGRKVVSTEPVLEYADSHPQLGYEPLRYENRFFHLGGPTWTEQTRLI